MLDVVYFDLKTKNSLPIQRVLTLFINFIPYILSLIVMAKIP